MKTHQFVSSAEAAKALGEGVGARHARRLIDDEARQGSTVGVQPTQVLEQLVIGEPLIALGQYFLSC